MQPSSLHSPTTASGSNSKLFLGLALLGLFCAATGVTAVQVDRLAEEQPPLATLEDTGTAFAQVAKHVAPAVVYIQAEKQLVNNVQNWRGRQLPHPFQDEWLKDFFGGDWPGHQFEFQRPDMPRDHSTQGQGSGFLISDDGYILTNSHVVRGASRLKVRLADGREYEGQIVGTDPRSDVAVIKIDATGLPQLNLGDSELVEVGEWVLAIGSPFGLPGTVTSGIVSAKGRSSVGITDYENFLQTDAAINPGNSGGPLVNLRGEVIGINTAIFSRNGANNGIGFAIPINMAHEICQQLISDGSVTRGYVGILIQPLTPELAASFDIDTQAGVLIGDVTLDSPAHHAGLRAGDVVTEFDGEPVKDIGAFRNLVAATNPASDVTIVVMREGERTELTVTVGQLPAGDSEAKAAADQVDPLGFSVQPLTDAARKQQQWDDLQGVVISHVAAGSRAAKAGLQVGMLIQEVNREPVRDIRGFHELVQQADDGGHLLLRVREGELSRFIVLPGGDE